MRRVRFVILAVFALAVFSVLSADGYVYGPYYRGWLRYTVFGETTRTDPSYTLSITRVYALDEPIVPTFDKVKLQVRAWTKPSTCPNYVSSSVNATCVNCSQAGYVPNNIAGSPGYSISQHKLIDDQTFKEPPLPLPGGVTPPGVFYTELYVSQSTKDRWKGIGLGCTTAGTLPVPPPPGDDD